MQPRRVTSGSRKRSVRSLVIAAVVMAGVVIAMPGASAGGWAVSTLDAMAAPVAGTDTEVGFTIRQHGVRPVNPEGRVAVSIRSAAGTETFFDGTAQGPAGHYRARVRFPDAGTYRWEIQQGWFAPHDLGQIRVVEAGAVGATAAGTSGTRATTPAGSEYRWPFAARLVLPMAGLALGAVGVAEMVRTRRRRSRALIAS